MSTPRPRGEPSHVSEGTVAAPLGTWLFLVLYRKSPARAVS